MIDKVNLQQTLDRWLAFVERRLEDGILARISHPATCAESNGPEAAGPVRVRECLVLEDLDGCVSRIRTDIQKYRDSLTDIIPHAYPTFDFGGAVYAGFFGGEIMFAGTSDHTWSACDVPPVKDLTQFDFPGLSADNLWLKRMLNVTDYFVNHMEPICDATPFMLLDCLNFLITLRGADGFTDLCDYPELVGRFMDWSVEVNLAVYDAQAQLLHDFTDKAYGGHPFSRYGRSRIPSMSVDNYGMCRPDVYERWGLEQHRRLVGHYGGGILHLHGDGRPLCELVSRNEGLSYCYMGDDAGFPKAFEIVEELKARMMPIPIAVDIPKEVFLRRLQDRSLPGGVLYRLSADSLEESNEIMMRVFEYCPKRQGK